MSTRPENEFPTISDLHVAVHKLVDAGLGALPIQVLVVPSSTLQLIAETLAGPQTKQALLIEEQVEGAEGRLPVTILTVEELRASMSRQ